MILVCSVAHCSALTAQANQLERVYTFSQFWPYLVARSPSSGGAVRQRSAGFHTAAIMGTLLLLLLFLTSLWCLLARQRRARLPPGAPSLPGLGSLPWMMWSGKHTIEFVKDDRKKYGNISTLRLPGFNMIFLNEPKLIRRVMNMEECAGRTQVPQY